MRRALRMVVLSPAVFVVGCSQPAPSGAASSAALATAHVSPDAGTEPHTPPQNTCRDETYPHTIAPGWDAGVGTTQGGLGGFDNPQGPYLEGPVLERFRFTKPRSWDASQELVGSDVCRNRTLKVTLKEACTTSYPYCILEQQQGLCDDGAAASAARVLVTDGWWDGSGRHVPDAGLVTLSCAAKRPKVPTPDDTRFLWNGAITKCFELLNPGQRTPEMMQACTRMMRADYCGHGKPSTLVGTRIGIWLHDPNPKPDCDEGYCFEATWERTGALCIGHFRYQDNRSRDRAMRDCRTDWRADAGPGLLCTTAPGNPLFMSQSRVHRRQGNSYTDEACVPDAGTPCSYP